MLADGGWTGGGGRGCLPDGDAEHLRQVWRSTVPDLVADLARRWSLDVGGPFQPGGVASWVAPARAASGTRLVLKVGWRHGEAMHEADGLAAWGGAGAVWLHDSLVVGDTAVLLLEACEPGTALSEALSPPEQDAVVAGLLRRLWIDPPAGHRFRALQSMCDWWADEFEARYAAAAPELRLDPGSCGPGWTCSEGCPARASGRCCCAPICTTATCSPPIGSRG